MGIRGNKPSAHGEGMVVELYLSLTLSRCSVARKKIYRII